MTYWMRQKLVKASSALFTAAVVVMGLTLIPYFDRRWVGYVVLGLLVASFAMLIVPLLAGRRRWD